MRRRESLHVLMSDVTLSIVQILLRVGALLGFGLLERP